MKNGERRKSKSEMAKRHQRKTGGAAKNETGNGETAKNQRRQAAAAKNICEKQREKKHQWRHQHQTVATAAQITRSGNSKQRCQRSRSGNNAINDASLAA